MFAFSQKRLVSSTSTLRSTGATVHEELHGSPNDEVPGDDFDRAGQEAMKWRGRLQV
jgi:hypothetical protein